MKWLLIPAICLLMIASFAYCEESDGLNLEIAPPVKTPPDSLNEISKDDNINDSFGGAIGDDDDASYELPPDDTHDKTDDSDDDSHDVDDSDFKTIKPEDLKFNQYVHVEDDSDDDDDDDSSNNNEYRAIFLARFLDPENLKALQERIRRSANDEPQSSNPSPKSESGKESQSVPLPDDDDTAGRFLDTLV